MFSLYKKQIFIAVGAVVILGAGTLIYSGFRTERPGSAVGAPRIIVAVPHAYLVENGSRGKEFSTGDVIAVPVTIETDALGMASVLFADGSVARLDSGTRVTLSENAYDAKSGKLIVRFVITIGRIWSKIVELATPDSAWEIKTSRAVATVRGTAFGVKTDASGSTFIGSEHSVGIAPIDPKTNNALTDKTSPLSENKFVIVTDADVAVALAGVWQANIQDISPDSADADWIHENESADDEQESFLSSIDGLSPEERAARLLEHFGVSVDDAENGEVTVKTDEGTWSSSNKLPENFPADVPIYPNAKVQSSVTATTAGQGGSYVGLETDDSPATVIGWYKAEVVAKGWKVTVNMEAEGGSFIGGSKDARNLMVTVSGESGKTVIGLAVTSE